MARRMSRLRLIALVAALPFVALAVRARAVGRRAAAEPDRGEARARSSEKKGRERVLTTTISGYTRRIDALQGDITTLQTRQVRIETDLDAQARRAGAAAGRAARGADPARPAARAARRVARRAGRPARRALQGRRARRRHRDPRGRRLRRPARARRVHAARLRAGRADHRPRPRPPRPRRSRPSSGSTGSRRASARSPRSSARRHEEVVRGQGPARRPPRATSRASRDTSSQALVSTRERPPRRSRATSPRSRRSRRKVAGAARRHRRAARRPGPPGLGQLHLAGQRHVHVAVRLPLGPAARRHRHRRAGGHADPRRRLRHGRARRAGPAATATTPASTTAAALSTCYGHQSRYRDVGRRERQPGPGHRLRRQHRPLVRRPPALRGPHQRRRRSTRWATSSRGRTL